MSRTRDAATYEEDERARAEYQNQALAERNRVHGAQRAQVPVEAPPERP